MITQFLDTLASAPHSVLPDVIRETQAKQEATVYVSKDDIIYSLFFTKFQVPQANQSFLEQQPFLDGITTFLTPLQIEQKDLQHAHVACSEIAEVLTATNSSLSFLYKKAATFPLKAQYAGIEITNTCSIFLHIKTNRTVRLIARYLYEEGSSKQIHLVTKFGFPQKSSIHASSPEDPSGICEEGAHLKSLSHPCIVEGGQFFQKKVSVWGKGLCPWSSKSWHSVLYTGIKERFYEKGDAYFLTKKPPESIQEVIERCYIIQDISLGLAQIHQRIEKKRGTHLAHMDVKPSNIFLTMCNGRMRGALGDINPIAEGKKALTTLLYCSPENMNSYVIDDLIISSREHDVWALGICLLEFMYGKDRDPFTKNKYQERLSSPESFTEDFLPELSRTFVSNPLVTTRINELIASMIAYKPWNRPKIKQITERITLCINELLEKIS